MVFFLLESACIQEESPTDAGGGGNGGGLPEGGAPACVPEYEALTGDQIPTVDRSDWPGPLLLSRESDAGDIGYVSLDPDGSLRWMTIGYDFTFDGTAVWETDAAAVIVTQGEEELDWPLAATLGITSIRLDRIDDRHIGAHVTATSGESDEVWIAGGLCHGCTQGPAYPCAFDFDAFWAVVHSEP